MGISLKQAGPFSRPCSLSSSIYTFGTMIALAHLSIIIIITIISFYSPHSLGIVLPLHDLQL